MPPTTSPVTPPATGSAAVPESASPRRLRGPTWLDLRLVTGVLLVLGSVLVGARVVSAADQSVQVWSATRDLSIGTTLRAEDIELVPVRLFESAPAYLSGATDLAGQVVDRPVRAGELLPASALVEPTDRVSVALPVSSTAVPLELRRGQLVDVYATGQERQGGPPITRLVLAAAPVQAVDGQSQGVLSSSGSLRQIVVSVPSAQAGSLLAAIAGRELALAILDDLTEPGGRSLPTGPLGTPDGADSDPPGAGSTTPTSAPPT